MESSPLSDEYLSAPGHVQIALRDGLSMVYNFGAPSSGQVQTGTTRKYFVDEFE